MGLIEEIKKSATDSRAKIQTSEAAQLEKILNRTFYLEKDPEGETEFVRQVMTRGLETAERTGLHASALIVAEKKFCMRQQVLSLLYKQLQGEQLPADLKRIFEEGNAVHEKWQRLFIRAGFSSVRDLDVTQFNTQWRVSYTPDIICYIPEFFEGKMIGELKSVNTFQFQKMSKHPSAGKQCQWYMALAIEKAKKEGTWNGVDFTKGFVLSEDKNTQQFKLEVYDYDPEQAAIPLDRCRSIKAYYKAFRKDGSLPSRPEDALRNDSKRCYNCPMREACWNIGSGAIPLEGGVNGV